MFAEVALPIPQDMTFTYRIPDKLSGMVMIGQRVVVPFRSRISTGFVTAINAGTKAPYTKDIVKALDEEALITPAMMELSRWIATTYVSSLGQTLQFLLSKSISRGGKRKTVDMYYLANKGLARKFAESLPESRHRQRLALKALMASEGAVEYRQLNRLVGIGRSSLDALVKNGIIGLTRKDKFDEMHKVMVGKSEVELTSGQRLVVERFMGSGKPVSLLFGVTGSGKTEVYTRLAKEYARQGKQTIVLVPEISLTPQLVSYFENRFPGRVAMLHSYMTPGERSAEWERILEGTVDVVVGARSAIFAPVRKLGLVVVDEEQDSSYKEHSNPQYHAVTVAIKRAELEGARVLLGAATPSLESFFHAKNGVYELLELPRKVFDVREPSIAVVDMREEKFRQKRFAALSLYLLDRISQTLSKGNQILLFVNRRGYSTLLFCFRCKFNYSCDRCSAPLAFHKDLGSYFCHYCMREFDAIKLCPRCGHDKLTPLGIGTQKVQEELAEKFQCQVARMDSDSMKSRKDYITLLESLYAGKTDVLIGTQMAVKGLDVEKITLVGIVYAEANLVLPDFRAVERTFQLIHQASGRAGRRKESAEIVIQTAVPEHFAITLAKANSYEKFYQVESAHRRDANYPPFCRLIRIVAESGDPDSALSQLEKVKSELAGLLSPQEAGAPEVLGPARPFFQKLRGRHRAHLLIKVAGFDPELWGLLSRLRKESHYKLRIDVDPISLL